ncbi:hypothetical protein SNE40_006760 [Patella caerulea]|uniref:Uncharacterized protein n=1 Tax=Patella caerulea TaxID=87958 RepID=A0AAN8JWL1_PATCE
MAKSKSERMKEYRARKKEKLGDKWLKMERNRVRAYYTPTDLLSNEEQDKRRSKNRKAARKFYKKQTSDKSIQAESLSNSEPTSVDENGVSSTTSESTMTVKFHFQCDTGSGNKYKGGKKRASRALKKSYRKIETLAGENETLKRKLKTTQKRLQRLKPKSSSPKTPKSKTDVLLRQSGINSQKVPEIRKRLVYGECVNEEVKHAIQHSSNAKESIHKVVSGKVIKRLKDAG